MIDGAVLEVQRRLEQRTGADMNDSWLGELGGDWYAQPFEVDGENKLIYEVHFSTIMPDHR